MPNLKEIKVKIESVKKTKKITSAMKLVAAARVRRVQKQVMAARPYASQLKQTINNLREAIKLDIDNDKYPLLRNHKTINKILLVIFSSDRGLCGGFNANINKAAIKRIEELKSEGYEVELLTIGRKATGFFESKDYAKVVKSYCNLPSSPRPDEAQLIAEFATKAYTDGAYQKVETVSTKFVSMVTANVETHTFLPINLGDEIPEGESSISSMTIFDPNVDALINAVLPMYVENYVFQCILESTASELAARMTAMSNATANATEFINKLVINYNKVRQAAITQELSEIVGGAAALA